MKVTLVMKVCRFRKQILSVFDQAQRQNLFAKPATLPLVRRTVREHQNQKYAYGHGALILLILLASSYRYQQDQGSVTIRVLLSLAFAHCPPLVPPAEGIPYILL